jgi:hypothetical protein
LRPYKFYKHENSTDLVIECIKSFEISTKRLSIKAKLYTIGYPSKLIWMDTDRFEINEENYSKWKLWEQK